MKDSNNKKMEQEVSSLETYIKQVSVSIPTTSVTKEAIFRNIGSEETYYIPSQNNYFTFITMSKKILIPSLFVILFVVGYFGLNNSTKNPVSQIPTENKNYDDMSSAELVDSMTQDLIDQSESETNEALAMVDEYESDFDSSSLDEIINTDY